MQGGILVANLESRSLRVQDNPSFHYQMGDRQWLHLRPGCSHTTTADLRGGGDTIQTTDKRRLNNGEMLARLSMSGEKRTCNGGQALPRLCEAHMDCIIKNEIEGSNDTHLAAASPRNFKCALSRIYGGRWWREVMKSRPK